MSQAISKSKSNKINDKLINVNYINVLCPKCKKKDYVSRIFKAYSYDDIVCCPYCGKDIKVSLAKKAYNNFLENKLKFAEKYLKDYNDSNNAYHFYSDIIEIDDNNIKAICGRILSLFKMSTVRDIKIHQVKSMIEMSKGIIFKPQNEVDAFLFVVDLSMYCFNYLKKIETLLSKKKLFYDLDCLSLYLIRSREISNFISYLKTFVQDMDIFKTILNESEFGVSTKSSGFLAFKDSFLKLSLPNKKSNELVIKINFIRTGLKVIEKSIKQTYRLSSGEFYICKEFKNDQPVLNKVIINGKNPRLPHVLKRTLSQSRHIVKNIIFINKKKDIRLMNFSFAFAMLFLIGVILFGVFSALNIMPILYCIFFASASLLVFLIFIIIYFIKLKDFKKIK